MGDYLVGPASGLIGTTSVDFAGQSFGAGGGEFNKQLVGGQVSVSLLSPVVGLYHPGTVGVSVIKERPRGSAGETVATGSGPLDPAGHANFSLFVKQPLVARTQYEVGLTYGDGLFFNTMMLWRHLSYRVPWYRGPYVVAVLVLLLPSTFLLLSLRHMPLLRRWVPVAVPACEAIAARFDYGVLNLTWQQIVLTAVCGLVVVLVAALFSPQTFRLVAGAQPYRFLVPFALHVPFVRRRFFAEYIQWLRDELTRVRSSALDESFYPIPCEIIEASAEFHKKGTVVEVESIARFITNTDERGGNVLIEAPGGRGKSALLNELVSRAIVAFGSRADSPLPVLGVGAADTVEKLVSIALGRYRVAEDLISGRLYMGDLVLFLDGATESGQDPAVIDTHFRTPEMGERIRICATTRPSDGWHKALVGSASWAVISPLKLTEQTVGDFVARYEESDRRIDSTRADAVVNIDGQKWQAARAGDGTYLPLLVRFAMLSGSHPVETVSDLYNGAIDRLILRAYSTADVQMLTAAARQIAIESYWEAGERTLEYERKTAADTEHVRKLLAAGLLISADGRISRIRRGPRRLRFIHDSIQSYLVAVALSAKDDWDALSRAAGDPTFVRAGSDLIAGESSELFDMCMHVFEPKEKLGHWLKGSLLEMGKKYSYKLSIDQIMAVITRDDSETLRAIDPRRMSTQMYTEALVEQAAAEGAVGLGLLGRLYGSLQRRVWNVEQDERDSNPIDERQQCHH
jgi:hypothetical protein